MMRSSLAVVFALAMCCITNAGVLRLHQRSLLDVELAPNTTVQGKSGKKPILTGDICDVYQGDITCSLLVSPNTGLLRKYPACCSYSEDSSGQVTSFCDTLSASVGTLISCPDDASDPIYKYASCCDYQDLTGDQCQPPPEDAVNCDDDSNYPLDACQGPDGHAMPLPDGAGDSAAACGSYDFVCCPQK